MQTLLHLLMFFNWGTESEPFLLANFLLALSRSHPHCLQDLGLREVIHLYHFLTSFILHHGGCLAFGFFPLSLHACTLLLVSPLVAAPLLYLFKPVLSPHPSLTRCLLGSISLSQSCRRAPPSLVASSAPHASAAPPPAPPPPLPGLLRVAAGLLRALLFQLCGPQQPWPTSRRASSPKTCKSVSTARRKRSAEGGGLRGRWLEAVRGRWQCWPCAAGPRDQVRRAAESEQARGGEVPSLCSQELQPRRIHSGSVGTVPQWVHPEPADLCPARH